MYYDPTGHWRESDKNLARWKQDLIVGLTDAYYDETDNMSKEEAHTIAQYLRSMSGTGDSKESFYDKFGDSIIGLNTNNEFYDYVSNTLTGENDYFSADEWKTASKKYKDSKQTDILNRKKILPTPTNISPQDYGKIRIGKDKLRTKDTYGQYIELPEEIAIHVPEYIDGSNADFNTDGWNIIEGGNIEISGYDTNWAKLIAGIEFEEINTSGNNYKNRVTKMSILSLAIGALQSYASNTIKTELKITIQEKESQYRAILQFGFSGTRAQTHAGDSFLYSDRYSFMKKDEGYYTVKNSFSGLNPDIDKYDVKVNVDIARRNDLSLGYISVNEDNELQFTSKLYSGDKYELGYHFGLFNKWNPVANIKSMYQKTSIINTSIQQKIRELISSSNYNIDLLFD